jgi:hypothetical protein
VPIEVQAGQAVRESKVAGAAAIYSGVKDLASRIGAAGSFSLVPINDLI